MPSRSVFSTTDRSPFRPAQGEFTDDDGGGYRWRLRVRPVATREAPAAEVNSGTPATLYDVEVAISWAGRNGDRSVVLKTLRLGTPATGE